MNSVPAVKTNNTGKASLATNNGGDHRWKMLDATIKRYQYQQDALIEILYKAQEIFGYLENDVLVYVAHSLKLPPSQVYGVATFYHWFSLAPSGVHTCAVCMGTACYVNGAQTILATLEKSAHLHAGETTPDRRFSLLKASCLGACGIAPAVVFDGAVVGYQTAELVDDHIKGWLKDGSS